MSSRRHGLGKGREVGTGVGDSKILYAAGQGDRRVEARLCILKDQVEECGLYSGGNGEPQINTESHSHHLYFKNPLSQDQAAERLLRQDRRPTTLREFQMRDPGGME